jgi:hypothetical protein
MDSQSNYLIEPGEGDTKLAIAGFVSPSFICCGGFRIEVSKAINMKLERRQ